MISSAGRLHRVLQAKQFDQAIDLLENNLADPNETDSSGQTALNVACLLGAGELVERLISMGVDTNVPGRSGDRPLHCAASAGRVDLIDLLLCRGAIVSLSNRKRQTAMYFACRFGQLDAARRLVEAGLLPTHADSAGNTGLHAAAEGGNFELAAWLVRGWPELLSVVNSRSESALHLAAAGAEPMLVKLLMADGAQIAQRDLEGNTPLHIAALSGRLANAKALLEGGADKSARNRNGNRPWELCCGRDASDGQPALFGQDSAGLFGGLFELEQLLK